MAGRVYIGKGHDGSCMWELYKLKGGVCKRCRERTGKPYYNKVVFKCGIPGCGRKDVRKHVHVA